MRSLMMMALVLSGPAFGQVSVGETGACMLEGADGAPLNLGTCRKMPANCTPDVCDVSFEWMADQFATVISVPSAGALVSEGSAMNGQEAYAPVALVARDGRDCIFNAVSEAVFCWVPGIDAFTFGAGGVPAWEDVILAAGAGSGDLLRPLQGKYIPPGLGWDCGEIGRDGGALAIQGDTFFGLESACTLRDGQAVGQYGAALFEASCEGEGDTWEDEYLLRVDDWGNLAVLRSDSVTVLQACQ